MIHVNEICEKLSLNNQQKKCFIALFKNQGNITYSDDLIEYLWSECIDHTKCLRRVAALISEIRKRIRIYEKKLELKITIDTIISKGYWMDVEDK